MLETLQDSEFGLVRIRRIPRAKYIRLRIRHDGSHSITMPKRVALKQAQTLLNDSRISIRNSLSKQPTTKAWSHGDTVGAVYKLVLVQDETVAACATSVEGSSAIVRHSPNMDDGELQVAIRSFVKKLLRKQAGAYIPRRLATLASAHGFDYQNVRFSNAETRWGSCSSSGTISLNIWLMTLPLELVDYVLVHELAHTRHMNHSPAFWQAVEMCLPDYKAKRRTIKQYSPRP